MNNFQLTLPLQVSTLNSLYQVCKNFSHYPLSFFQLQKLSYAISESKETFLSLFNDFTEGFTEKSSLNSHVSHFFDTFTHLPSDCVVKYKLFSEYEHSPFGKHSFDSGTCFDGETGERRMVFDMLKANCETYPTYFVEVLKDETFTNDCTIGSICAVARAILIIVDNVPIVFNTYSKDSDIYTSKNIANYFAERMKNKITKKVNLSNQGADNNNLFWVNGSIGYAIIDEGNKEKTFFIDIDENDYNLEGEGEACCHCGCHCNDDDYRSNDNGEIYCEDCYCDIFARCENCDHEIDTTHDTYYTVTIRRNDSRCLCADCVTVL